MDPVVLSITSIVTIVKIKYTPTSEGDVIIEIVNFCVEKSNFIQDGAVINVFDL